MFPDNCVLADDINCDDICSSDGPLGGVKIIQLICGSRVRTVECEGLTAERFQLCSLHEGRRGDKSDEDVSGQESS